jgi:hypothetical protein
MVFEPQTIEQGMSNFEVFPSLPRFEIPCSIFEISNIFGWALSGILEVSGWTPINLVIVIHRTWQEWGKSVMKKWVCRIFRRLQAPSASAVTLCPMKQSEPLLE